MAGATVTIKGLDGVIKRLRAFGHDVDGIVDGALKKSAEQIAEKTFTNIQNMSVSYNGHIYDAEETGELARSLSPEKAVKKIPHGYSVGTPVKYAPYVEFGTGSAGDPRVAHTARPRWVYYNKALGGLRTAYPRPPCPFLLPAFKSHRDIAVANVKAAIIKAWRDSS